MIPRKVRKDGVRSQKREKKIEKYLETGLSFESENGTMWWKVLKIYVLEPKTITIGCKDADR